MNQEGCSIKRQKVKNFNYVSAGSLASLRNKKVSKHKHKQNSACIPVLQVTKSNEKYHKQVQQQLPDSTTPASQVAHEQVQQDSQLPITPSLQSVQEQMLQCPHDSTNLEENNQSEEQDNNI